MSYVGVSACRQCRLLSWATTVVDRTGEARLLFDMGCTRFRRFLPAEFTVRVMRTWI